MVIGELKNAIKNNGYLANLIILLCADTVSFMNGLAPRHPISSVKGLE